MNNTLKEHYDLIAVAVLIAALAFAPAAPDTLDRGLRFVHYDQLRRLLCMNDLLVFSGIAAGLTVGAAADTVPVTRNAILRGNAVHCMARAPNLPAILESPQLAASLSGAGSSLGRLPLHTVFLGRVKHVLSRSNWKCSLEALTGALLPALGTRLALYKHYEENLCDPYSC